MNNNKSLAFSFDSHSVRTFDRDGEIWFVAADVCAALTISNPRDAVAKLDDDEKATVGNPDARPGNGAQELNIISEAGLYRLTLTSRKAEAKRFTRWVTHEVLPAIRKTGQYNGGTGITLTEAEATNLAGLLQLIPMFTEAQQQAEGIFRAIKSPMAPKMFDAWHETGIFAWALRDLGSRCALVRAEADARYAA